MVFDSGMNLQPTRRRRRRTKAEIANRQRLQASLGACAVHKAGKRAVRHTSNDQPGTLEADGCIRISAIARRLAVEVAPSTQSRRLLAASARMMLQ